MLQRKLPEIRRKCSLEGRSSLISKGLRGLAFHMSCLGNQDSRTKGFYFYFSNRKVNEIKEGIKSGVPPLLHNFLKISVAVSIASQVGRRKPSKCNSQTQQETALWCQGLRKNIGNRIQETFLGRAIPNKSSPASNG